MIEFENAGFSYGQTAILRDLNLTLAPGSFTVLIGRPGAGKTTFVRLCHLELAPTTGSVRHFGRRLPRRSRNAVADLRRAVGVVHQACRFIDHLPLIENVALPLRVSGADATARAEDIAALLEWVGLGDRARAHPAELSSAERRRAALARAVILSPDMIVADEPTGGIEGRDGLGVLALLAELNRMGKAVVIATSDPDALEAAAAQVEPQVLEIDDGRLLPAGADA